MKHITKLKLAAIHQICGLENKSNEYMCQYMIDNCNVDIDNINSYMANEDHESLFNEVNELIKLITLIERTI